MQTDMPDVLCPTSTGAISVSQRITRSCPLEQGDEVYEALNRKEIIGRAIDLME